MPVSQLTLILLTSWLAGAATFIGGLLAWYEGSAETEGKRELVHGVVALGGGVLLAAVAFSLAPEGMAYLSPLGLAATFCAGGLAFCCLDAYLARRGEEKAQWMAMMMDSVPESIALGALIGHDYRAGILLALFIGAQNLPEGFNAFRESRAGGSRPRSALLSLLATSLSGPAAALAGYLLLQDQPVLTASIMSFAAGGILYLIFQDIAPQAKMRKHWIPPMGAIFGFVIGMVGKQVLG